MTLMQIFKNILKWGAVAAAVVVLCAAALFGVLQTEGGRQGVAGLAERALTEEGWRRVEIGRIQGIVPFRFELDRLLVDNRFGLSLSLRDLRIDWSPWSLVQGDLHVRTLKCGFLDFERLPGEGGEKRPPLELPRWLAAFGRFKVDHLAVDELVLGGAVLGEKAVFQLNANLNASLPGGEWVTRLQLDRMDGPEMRLLLNGTIRESGRFLLVEAEGRESAGGLFSRSVGIPGPMTISLRGEGPVSDWKAGMKVGAGGAGKLQAEIRASYSGPLTIEVKGSAAIEGEFLSEYLGAGPGEEVRFSMSGGLGEDRRVTIDHLSVEAEEAALKLSDSSIAKDGGITGRVEFRHNALNRIAQGLQFPVSGRVTAEGSVSGRLRRPSASIAFRVSDLKVDRAALSQGSGEVQIEVEEEGGEGTELRLRGEGWIRGLSLERTALPEKDLQWALSLARPSSGILRVGKMSLQGARNSIQISGDVDPVTGAGKFGVEVETRDLRSLGAGVGLNLAGTARMKAGVEGRFRDGSFSADIQTSVKPQVPGGLQPLFPNGLEGKAKVSLEQGRRLTLSELALTNALAKATGSVVLDLSTLKGAGSAQIEFKDLGPLSSLAGIPLGGTLVLKGSVDGSLERMNLRAEIEGERVSMRAIGLGGIRAEFQASGPLSSPEGHFHFAAPDWAGGISGRSRFALEGERLSLTELLLQGPGQSFVRGDLALDTAAWLVEGGLDGGCLELEPFSPLVGRPLKGRATFRADLRKSRKTQQLDLALSGRELKAAALETKEFTIRATLEEITTSPRGRAAVEGSNLEFSGVRLSSFRVETKGTLQEVAFSGRAGGELDRSFDLEAEGMFRPVEMLRFNRLSGRYGRLPFRLTDPAEIEATAGDVAARELKFALGTGTLSGAGRIGSGKCDLSLKMADLPLPLLAPAHAPSIEGVASGEVTLRGRPERPEGTARFRFSGLRLQNPKLKGIPPALLEVRADLQGERLHGEFALEGVTPKPLSGVMDMPLHLSFSPLETVFPQGKGLRAELSGEVDLGRIGRFFGLDDQEMAGVAQIELRAEGSTDKPRITGTIALENGSYENARSGTVLRGVDILLRAESGRLTIERAVAGDGEEGKVVAAGWLEIDPAGSFPFQVDLDFQKAKVLRHDWLTAKGEGRVQLKGTFSHAVLSGEVQVESGEFRIPDRVPPEKPKLEVIEIHGSEPREPLPGKKIEGGSGTEFDLRVKSPGRFFVRGRGLESEWRGELRIKGPVDALGINGELTVDRGRFNFLDRRFTLTQGRMVFSGMGPSSPFLDVSAQSNTKDMTAHLRLSGPVRSLEIKLSSDPPFPPDEVLSRLLFGQGVSRASPMQALQLAQALNMLSGSNTLDLLGATQKLLKVDQLEVKQSGENKDKTSISAGKYLGDTVYMEVEQKIGPKGTKALVDWEIAPHISVETELGADAESGVGLNWKWDY
jgi:translocation and assembly module TamB